MNNSIYIIKLRNKNNMQVCFFKNACKNRRGFIATYFDSNAKMMNYHQLEIALNYLKSERQYYDISVVTL